MEQRSFIPVLKKILPLSLITVAGSNSLTCSSEALQSNTTPPNIVIFLTDDQGYGDFSITGNTNLKTPNIDKMASRGAMFTNFYVSPVCAPTRAEFLTGRYHLRSGVTGVSRGAERIDLDETTIADVFSNAGYSTAAFGKWHSGMQYPYHPNGRGFDEFYGFCSGHWGDYFSPTLEHNGNIVQGDGYLPDDLTNKAMTFIEQNKDNPFFVYIPYNTPHSPMQVPDEWWDKFKDIDLVLQGTQDDRENIVHTRAALAMCENIDWNVGRVVAKLKELNLEENTIVLFFNDNGPNGHRWNAGMKGVKGSTDEGGVRSPLFITWPGVIPSGKEISEISGAIDLLPTLADLAGIELNTRRPLDGISTKSLILEGDQKYEDRLIFSHWNGRSSVRNQQYRFSHDDKLYDLIADPKQTNDISGANPELAHWFNVQISEWISDVSSGLTDSARNFPVGHPDFRHSQLPARDGDGHGGIERSNRFPNSSYFTNWNSLSGKITWPVEVLDDGEFDVKIYYTCKPGNEGSELKLSFGAGSLVTTIIEAHDPPLIGMENDRVARQESYEKDFKAHRAGVIQLKKGTGEMTLEALTMPGSEVIDFKLLMLTKIN
jgi:arylsulfatase A-like enzyme